MFKNLFYILFFLSLIQCTNHSQERTKQLQNYLLHLHQKNTDPNLSQDLDANDIFIIKQCLQAEKIADQVDKENNTSKQYFLNSIERAKKLKKTNLEIWARLRYASYLYNYRNMPESLPLVIQLIQDIKEVQPEEIIDPKETYTFIGFYLSTIFQYEEASQYLKKAIEYSKDDTESTAMYLDNIGFNLLRMKKFTEAEYILNKAKNLSLKTNNQNRLAKVYGNLADLNIQLNKNEEAIQLLQKDIQISRKTNQEQNTMYALILLSKAYLRTNQVVLAKKSIEEAKEIALKKDYYKSSLLQIQEIIKTIAINEKDEKLELISQRSIDQLKLDLRNFDGNETLQNSHYSNLISNLRMNQEHTKFEYERSQIANKAMGISIFLIMGISVLIF